MTLKEKFKKEGFSNCEYLEQVADEFAIKFKDWCDNEGRFVIGTNTTKELLEIYKKESNL